MPARALSLCNLVKSYEGGDRAVDDVSLEVAAGEFVSLLGPSGSGKTTTLMMIAGFQKPDAGAIVLGGRDIVRVPPHRRSIGMVFQNYALFPHMSVADNIGFPLRMRGIGGAERTRRVAAALEKVSLAHAGARYPAQLSGGQQQRVSLARALVFEPDLVLLDEPLGALDKALREQMQLELKRIHRELGVTMIYVTHDQSEAMTMSDRIAVFNQGRIEQVGTPGDVYGRPATRFVAGFVGDSNIFPAVVDHAGRCEAAGLGLIGAAGHFAPGSPVDVLVRPESIRLSTTEGPDDRGRFEVDATVNYGESSIVIGRAGDVPLRARVSSRDAEGLKRGGRYHMSWADESSHAMPSGAGTR